MNEKVALIDAGGHEGRLLRYLLEQRIGKVRVDLFPDVSSAVRSSDAFLALVHTRLSPDADGRPPESELAELSSVHFEGVGLIVISSGYFADPVFDAAVRSQMGRIVLVNKALTTWAEQTISLVEAHCRLKWLTQAWSSFFPILTTVAPFHRFHPSTQLALLKHELRAQPDGYRIGNEVKTSRFIPEEGDPLR